MATMKQTTPTISDKYTYTVQGVKLYSLNGLVMRISIDASYIQKNKFLDLLRNDGCLCCSGCSICRILVVANRCFYSTRASGLGDFTGFPSSNMPGPDGRYLLCRGSVNVRLQHNKQTSQQNEQIGRFP
ncbi:uncharacterized protein LOC111259037 [Varroa jacobsoni]|uniref:uncharacterized protein LOC111259037 n=1 Tax=Varroa jacobsoni TaxID=62625 RepID=UPI000BFA566E|nr:uncharacterized protein LOC111259037 [Varroa jacobsoni]